ncbi:MAG: TetR/AcrR family transcriptional regulator [Firmicutes bacterium]|nr:TetR/AcrR family transcriptional regulator [Bacillota bacterium]
MPDITRREDLRVMKTRRALCTALFTLLRRRNFTKITVRGICEEAMVSRTVFYAHFSDKYDLLEHALQPLHEKLAAIFFSGDDRALEDFGCSLLQEHMIQAKNVLADASYDMIMLLFRFFAPLPGYLPDTEHSDTQLMVRSYVVGGIYSVLLTQLHNCDCRDEAALRANIACVCRLVRRLFQQLQEQTEENSPFRV